MLFKRDVTLFDWPVLDLWWANQKVREDEITEKEFSNKAMHNYLSVFLSVNQPIFDYSSTKQQEKISSDHVNKHEKNLISISKIISKGIFDQSGLGART